MTARADMLAEAMQALRGWVDEGRRAIRSSVLQRKQRELLVSAGLLFPVIKGWYMPMTHTGANEGKQPDDWSTALRQFVRGYCDERFGADWYVSPEISVQLHLTGFHLPDHVVVHALDGNDFRLDLPRDSSLFIYGAKDFAPGEARGEAGGLRVLKMPWALLRVPQTFFATHLREAYAVLTMLQDVSQLSQALLAGRHWVVAGRLIGALRAAGRQDLADELRKVLVNAGIVVHQSNPFPINPRHPLVCMGAALEFTPDGASAGRPSKKRLDAMQETAVQDDSLGCG